MKKTIKSIIFDYGCVISKQQNQNYVKKMANILKIDTDTFIKTYIEKRHNYDKGTISAAEYWEAVAEEININVNNEIINKLINFDIKSWTDLNKKMLSYIQTLKPDNLSILSNMTYETKNYICDKFKWLVIFNKTIFSCDINYIKPEKEIYEYCLNQTGISAEKSLFIDDSEKNVAGAKALGINSIQFKDFNSFYEEINNKYILN